MRRWILVIALLVATATTAQDWTVLPQHWLPPVPTIADLPATGNQLGDVREVIAGPTLYCWDGGSWIACGGSGGGSGAVDSVFGRSGVVVAQPDDYSCDQVTDCVPDAVATVFGRSGDVVGQAGDYSCDQVTDCVPDAVATVFGRSGDVTAQVGDYSCGEVTGCVSGALTSEADPTLTDDGAVLMGDGISGALTQTFDLAGVPDPTLRVDATAFELDGMVRSQQSCVGPNCDQPECDASARASSPVTVCDEEPTIAFIESGTVDTLWRMGGDVHRFVLQDAVSNATDSSPPTVFPAVHDGRFCRGVADVCDESFCSPACPCNLGQGDCDTDADCLGDYVCGTDNGAASGCGATVDVCVEG